MTSPIACRAATVAFTLLELLVVVCVVGILASLVLPTLGRAKRLADRTSCSNNLRQLNLGLRMYADDHSDAIRARTNREPLYATYKESIIPYLSRGGSTTNEAVFICPVDDFNCDDHSIAELFLFEHVSGKGFYRQAATCYSSYFFNGMAPNEPDTRMAGKPFSNVRAPSQVVLVAEFSGDFALSGHERKHPYQFQDARNVLSFVDGHVGFSKIYWNGIKGFDGIAALYEPPPGYDYRWSDK